MSSTDVMLGISFCLSREGRESCWRVWSTRLMKRGWWSWGCLFWRKGDSGAFSLSTTLESLLQQGGDWSPKQQAMSQEEVVPECARGSLDWILRKFLPQRVFISLARFLLFSDLLYKYSDSWNASPNLFQKGIEEKSTHTSLPNYWLDREAARICQWWWSEAGLVCCL